MIFVSEYVSDPRNLGPAHFGMRRFLDLADSAAGFRDDLQSAFDGPLHLPTAGEGLEVGAGQGLLNPDNGFGNVLQSDPLAAHRPQNTWMAEPSMDERSRGWMLPRLITSARACRSSAIRS